MPRFPRYSLEPHLVVLREDKKQALEALAATLERLRQEEEKLQALRIRQEELKATREEWTREFWAKLRSGLLPAADVERRRDHLEGIALDIKVTGDRIRVQEDAVSLVAEEVEDAREALLRVANELKVHEELKERWRLSILAERARQEQKETDEVGQILHQREKKEEW